MPSEHIDPILSFGAAIELCKQGIPVACTNMSADEFVVLTPSQDVDANNFWNVHNKARAVANGGKLWVKPYFLITDNYSTVPFTITNEHIFETWVKADTQRRLVNIMKEVDNDGIKLIFQPVAKEHQNEPTPFWVTYDELDMTDGKVMVLGMEADSGMMLAKIVDSMQSEFRTRDNGLYSTTHYNDGCDFNFNSLFNDKPLITFSKTNHLRLSLEAVVDSFKNHGVGQREGVVQFVVDVDSMVGMVSHEGLDMREHVTRLLQSLCQGNPKVKWCALSLTETLEAFKDVEEDEAYA